jgi:hypothetical protein
MLVTDEQHCTNQELTVVVQYVNRRFTDGCTKITNVTTAKTAP